MMYIIGTMFKFIVIGLVAAAPFITILSLLLLGFATLSLIKAWLRGDQYECYRYYRKVKRYLIITNLFVVLWFAEVYFTQ